MTVPLAVHVNARQAAVPGCTTFNLAEDGWQSSDRPKAPQPATRNLDAAFPSRHIAGK
tara:strand:+ start:821 stop:994 length:174 start_codon:yes stop_codon:yes gene_type:complete